LYLLHSLTRNLDFWRWCFLRLFNERVQYHHALPNKKTIERSSNAKFAARAQFEQPATKGA